ncbi:MAG: tRNA 4-thiouridine(8) synthase ThiI, partial [Clostridia bacterium]|nr:tRNA 4-thiouridine(8) synthase ThiI [Clostridia bacterium]
YQLYDDKLKGRLENVTDMLMMPEYLLYKLSGVKAREFTNATTMGMINAQTLEFDREIIGALALPPQLFPKLSQPGTTLGRLLPEIAAEVGGYVLSEMPELRVDVKTPEIVVQVEIREFAAYIHAGQFKGAGGMPVGTNGKALLLLSGGIDSPVAGYMIAKRGVQIDAVHFESFPYTSELAREKVFTLARQIAQYAGSFNVHVVSLTHIQEELVKNCEEDYFTLILRRYMMAIADRIAHRLGCGGLVTGESLGQVASQTMQAIGVTDPMTSLPVFRPCIGLDKEEIVQIARKIGTFETSIQPYEDCCTVFTPKHPKTKPELAKVEEQQRRLDFDALVQEALDGAYVEHIRTEF